MRRNILTELLVIGIFTIFGAIATNAQNNLIGKYAHHGKAGETSYEFVFELQSKNVAVHTAFYTGATSETECTWKWNKAKKLLAIRLSTDTEGDTWETYVFKLAGKNLKLVKKPEESDFPYSVGTVFKKL